MKTFYLHPVDGRKSFYRKACVTVTKAGEKVLRSYTTDVCKITADGQFVRMWNGYSATTMRHVNSFLDFYGLPGGGKAWWDNQPIRA